MNAVERVYELAVATGAEITRDDARGFIRVTVAGEDIASVIWHDRSYSDGGEHTVEVWDWAEQDPVGWVDPDKAGEIIAGAVAAKLARV